MIDTAQIALVGLISGGFALLGMIVGYWLAR